MNRPRPDPPGCRIRLRPMRLVVDLGTVHRCLSSAVLGGGLGWVRTWLNLQVPPDYGRADPDVHLRASSAGLVGPVVGMMTAAPVTRFSESAAGEARAVATVGVTHAMAAATTRPRPAPTVVSAGRRSCEGGPPVGTINLMVVAGVALSDGGLANALQTAVEAKAQALAAAGIRASNAGGFATGTATDSICIACPPGGREPFAGPATRIGGELAMAVYEAVLAGAVAAGGSAGRGTGGREAG